MAPFPILLLAAALAAADADAFYNPDEVQTVHLDIPDAEMRRMLDALPRREFGRGTFRWRDAAPLDVAVRFKGDSSSSRRQQHKRSFLVKFNEYDRKQRFLGLRRVSFDNGVQFGGLFSEPVITEILRREGIPAHRANHARLFLNGEFHGIFVNVERIDESFIENQLPDPDGMLFKVEGGPGADLRFIGEDPAAYTHFEAETKSAEAGRRRLVEFIRTINHCPPDQFAAKLDACLETDDFLRTAAVLLLSGAFDQLTGWNAHNYYLYHDGRSGRWRYLPWDLDVGFADNAFGRIRVIEAWNAAWPVPGPRPSPLLERIVSDPGLLARYRRAARAVLDAHFEPAKLNEAIDAKYRLIRNDLDRDPFPRRRVTNPGDNDYDDVVASMKAFVRFRHDTALRQLENPGERPAVAEETDPRLRIERKMERVQRAARAMERKGQNLRPIQDVLKPLGPLVQEGRFEEAEKLVDKALELVGDTAE